MTPDDHVLQDPALDAGEWVFRRSGEVFGPVDSRALAAMLYRGELNAASEISAGDGTWRRVGEEPRFALHARRAEAGLRVEREVTGERLLRARRRRARTLAALAGLAALGALVLGGAYLLARREARTSPLLEDFGAGVRIAQAARVGVGTRALDEGEVEVPVDAPAGGAPAASAPANGSRRAAVASASAAASAPRREPGAAPPRGAVDGGDLVSSQFDPVRIQAAVARQQRTLAPCFREEASRSPEFAGDIPIKFAIANDGRVAKLWIDDPRLRGGPLQACLEAALAGWRFEPFPGQRPTVQLAFRIGR
jgi:hypothetical protein